MGSDSLIFEMEMSKDSLWKHGFQRVKCIPWLYDTDVRERCPIERLIAIYRGAAMSAKYRIMARRKVVPDKPLKVVYGFCHAQKGAMSVGFKCCGQ